MLFPQNEETSERIGEEIMPVLSPEQVVESDVSGYDTPPDIDPRRDIGPLLDMGDFNIGSEANRSDRNSPDVTTELRQREPSSERTREKSPREQDPSPSQGGARPKVGTEPKLNVAAKYGFSPMKKGQKFEVWLREQCVKQGLDKRSVKKELKAETEELIQHGRRSQRIKDRERRGVNVTPWKISHQKKLFSKRSRMPMRQGYTALWSNMKVRRG